MTSEVVLLRIGAEDALASLEMALWRNAGRPLGLWIAPGDRGAETLWPGACHTASLSNTDGPAGRLHWRLEGGQEATSRVDREAAIETAVPARGSSTTVQIAAEPYRSALGSQFSKPAVVTVEPRFESLALIYMPAGRGVSVSRHLRPEGRRKSLRRLMEQLAFPGGWIIRRHASDLGDMAVEVQARWLMDDAAQIAVHPTSAAAHAALLAAAAAAVSGSDTVTVMAAADAALNGIEAFAAGALAGVKVRVQTADPEMLAELAEEVLRPAMAPVVPFGRGGSVVIEPGETLTAMDINLGGEPLARGLVAGLGVAGEAIALRRLSGTIVIDLPMTGEAARMGDKALQTGIAALCAAIEPVLGNVTVHGLTATGLLEISLPRRYKALHEWRDHPAIAAYRT